MHRYSPLGKTPVLVLTALAALALAGNDPLTAQGKGNGNGNKGGKGGNAVDQDIPAVMTVKDPSSTSAGTLKSDGLNGNTYDCSVGRRRSIGFVLGKRNPRTMKIQLGTELTPQNGDNTNPDAAAAGKIDFFSSNNVPNPSADGGAVTEVTLRIVYRENVSALGAFPVDENRPNYCDLNWQEIPDEDVDENDPTTFSRMCTTMRMDFKSGDHQWRIFFGPPNRRYAPQFQPTHPDAGAVRLERFLPSGDPLDKTVPWSIEATPWNTTDTGHARYGKIVGYLFYRGTKRQDPYTYAGAFDVRWADSAAKWEVVPK